LESLKITEEYVSNRNRTTELALSEEMLAVPTLVVYDEIAQAVILKSIVSDLSDLIVTRQNLKTSREKSDYSSKTTES